MSAHAPTVVTLTPDQAEALRALVGQLEGGGLGGLISAQQAARLAKRRTATVLEALKTGELPGKFHAGTHGGRGHWSIVSAAVVAWARNA